MISAPEGKAKPKAEMIPKTGSLKQKLESRMAPSAFLDMAHTHCSWGQSIMLVRIQREIKRYHSMTRMGGSSGSTDGRTNPRGGGSGKGAAE